MRVFLLFLVLLFLIPFVTQSQVMVSPTGKPSSLVICGPDGLFSLQIANTSGTTMTNATLLLNLPAGTRYTPGSVTGAAELNIANLNQPTFTVNPVANNTAHTVTFNAAIICGYTNTQNFVYTVTYNSSNYSGTDGPLQNFYYPDPVITSVNPASVSVPVNSTANRVITIQQQGANASTDTVILLDQHTSDIQVISVSAGTLHFYSGPGPLIVDTIIFTGSDLPGGNNSFDPGEVLTITETVKLKGCINGQSTLKTTWGCYQQYCSYNTAYGTVLPTSGSPSVNIAFTGTKKGWGFTDNKGFVEFNVVNTGSGSGGTAFDLVILSGFSSGGSTYYPNANWINKIDSFSVGGNRLPASYSYAVTAVNGQYAFYTNLEYTFDPDGSGTGLEDVDGDGFYDDLPVGKSFIIRASTYYSWTQAQSSIPIGNNCGQGWTNSAWNAVRFGYNFKNQCKASSGVSWVPNGNTRPFDTYSTTTLQTSISPDLYNALPDYFDHTVNTSTNVDNEGCPNDSVVYKLIFPPGVSIYPSIPATFKGVSMGSPIVSGDTVRYILNKSKILSGGLFHVPVVADCNLNPPATGTIHAELRFWCDKTNYKTRYFTYWCGDSPVFGIQCPSPGCQYPTTSMFMAERTTMGWTSNSCTTRTSPSATGIRKDNALAGDSIRITVAGGIHSLADSVFIQIKHSAIGGAWGNQLFFIFITDTLRYFDAVSRTWHVCAGLNPQITNGTTSYLKTYLGGLTASGGCLAGYQFKAGDSLVYIVYGKVKPIAQNEWRTIPTFRANFYYKDQNLDLYCNDLGASFNVLGSNYGFTAGTNYQQIVLSGCTSFLYEGLISRTLDVCGGNPGFPNEIRPLYVIDTMFFTLPEGFVYQTGTSRHTYFQDNGTTATEVISDPTISVGPAGTVLRFIRGSTWKYSDYYDCWNDYDRITFNATPSCKATGDYTYKIDARGRNQFCINGSGNYQSNASTKTVTYTPPQMNLTRLISTAEGRQDTVYWKVSVCNQKTFSSDYNWLGFESADNEIQIVKLQDVTVPASPVNITLSNYGPGKFWGSLGTFSGSACRTYQVWAVYNTCSFDSITIRHGYNCAGYPMNPELGYPPSGYICQQNQSFLYLDPKDVSLNLALVSPANPVSLCDTLDYEATVTNSQLSYAYNLKFTVTVQPGINILGNSSEFRYPSTTGSWISLGDPVNLPPGSNKWVYDISLDPNGVALLKGSDSIPKNSYKIRFKMLTDCLFTSGRSIKVTASASNACGTEKTRSSYSDPVIISGLPSNVNLYVLSTTPPPAFPTCSSSSTTRIKVINLGPSAVSSIEELGINIDDAFDYVNGSLNGIHNGPTGIASNIVAGGIRYINFSINPNLQVNDSIVFTFDLHDIAPADLTCDTIQLETSTLLVAQVPCATAPGGSCLIHSATSTTESYRPVIKDRLQFGTFHATSVLSGSAAETVTIAYHIRNTGTAALSATQAKVIFVHDANGNGLPDDVGADSLYFQTLSVGGLQAGDSIAAMAVFTVPSGKICQMLAGLRLPDNSCLCGTTSTAISSITLSNAGPDLSVCTQAPLTIGLPATTGYTYIWVPGTYLSSYTLSQPVFTYPFPITVTDTIMHVLTTLRPGNCLTRDTMNIFVQPVSTAFAGPDSSICSGQYFYNASAIATAQQSLAWSSSGSGSFNDATLLHPTYTPSASDLLAGSVNLTLNVTGYCGNSSDPLVLSFLTSPSGYAGKDSSVCNGTNYVLSDATAAGYSSLSWQSLGDGIFSNTSVLNPSYTPGPADTAAGFARLVLTVFSLNTCPAHLDTMRLDIRPLPLVTTQPLNRAQCSGDSSHINLSSNIPGTSFSWTAASSTPDITGWGPGSGSSINQKLFNNGTVNGWVTYSVTPSAGVCNGPVRIYTDTVKPRPVITNTLLNKGICSSQYTGIQLVSSLNLTTFTWTATASSTTLTGWSSGSGNNIDQQLFNSAFVTDSVTYVVTPHLNGCDGSPVTFTVRVNPIPDLTNQPLVKTICPGTSTNILLTSNVSGTLCTWTATPSGPAISGYSSNLTSPSVLIDQVLGNSGNTAGSVTYLITPSANSCPGQVYTYTVYVSPEPVLGNSPPFKSQCSGQFTGISLISNVPGTTFTWRAFSTSPTLSGFYGNPGPGSLFINQLLQNSGTATDTVIYRLLPLAGSCSGDSADFRVAVFPVPTLAVNPPSETVCSGNTTNISLSSQVQNTAFSWTASASGGITGWAPGSGSLVSQTLSTTSLTAGNVVYAIQTTANGCSGQQGSATVTVNPAPQVSLTPCFDRRTVINAAPIRLKGGVPAGGTFSGTGVSSGYFNPATTGTGTFYVKYTYTNSLGCPRSDSTPITVLPVQSSACGSSMTDVRDGRRYPTFVLPNGKCWMAANLNFGDSVNSSLPQTDNCFGEKYCSLNLGQSCTVYGGMYQWNEIMQYDTPQGAKGMCPPGWHIPTSSEWDDLMSWYYGPGAAGGFLKDTIAPNSFHGHNSGILYMNSSWNVCSGLYAGSMYWTSTAEGSYLAVSRGLNAYNPSVSRYYSSRANAFNVRCVRD